MSEDVTDVIEEPRIPPAEAPAEPTQISFADLAAAVQIIDVFVARGAVRGEEMSSVGQVRDRLAAFVKEAQEAQEAQAEAPAE